MEKKGDYEIRIARQRRTQKWSFKMQAFEQATEATNK